MNNQNQPKKLFQPAKRSQSKLRLALMGISGTGKTYGALLIAKGLGGRIAVIDTENNSASLYDDLVSFDTLNMRHDEPGGYHPRRYVEYIKAAEAEGYDTLIIDSISPEWEGIGGMLQLSEQMARTKTRGNTFIAWNLVNPFHAEFINAILQSRMHIIVTIKQKTDYLISTDQNNKTVVSKVGLKPIQRDNFEYDYSVVLELNSSKYAIPSKDRTRVFDSEMPFQITEETGQLLSAWLNENEDTELKKERTAQDFAEPPMIEAEEAEEAKQAAQQEMQSALPEDVTAEMLDFLNDLEEAEQQAKPMAFEPSPELVSRMTKWVERAQQINSFTGAIEAAKKHYQGDELVYALNQLTEAEANHAGAQQQSLLIAA